MHCICAELLLHECDHLGHDCTVGVDAELATGGVAIDEGVHELRLALAGLAGLVPASVLEGRPNLSWELIPELLDLPLLEPIAKLGLL
eukprot:12850510-Alexandrium_andersonii.AAC.1